MGIPAAVVFDMDGVIFDTENLISRCWLEVGERHGLKDIQKGITATIGVNRDASRRIMKELFGQDFAYDLYMNEARELFKEKYGSCIPVKKGVREILSFLNEKRVPVAIASSTAKALVEEELLAAGLREFFNVVIGGDMVTRSKPDPDIFIEACKALGKAPEQCVGIEDSYNGVRALHSAGLYAIMVPDMLEATDEMRRLSDRILPDLIAVLDHMRELAE